MSRLTLNLLGSFCTLTLLGATSAWAEAAASAQPRTTQEAPLDSEFWELYDELADDSGRLPAPEEIPPPKESLLPTPNPDRAKEEQ